MNINFSRQFRDYGKVILIEILILNVILLISWGIIAWQGLPIESLLEDTASLLGINQFVGFLTPIGAIVLSMGIGAVLLLAALPVEQFAEDTRHERQALYALAAVSLFLLLDDLFLLHERVFTGLFKVGEHRIFLTYGLIFLALVYVHRKGIISGPLVLLIIATLLFGISLASDFLTDKISFSTTMTSSMKMLEEGAKLGGYIFWSAFILMKVRGLVLSRQN